MMKSMPFMLVDVPIGAIIRHPDFPGHWEIVSQHPLLTCVRRVGSESLVDFFSRERVMVAEWPEVEDLQPQPTPFLAASDPAAIM
jgi:hypothetical protein